MASAEDRRRLVAHRLHRAQDQPRGARGGSRARARRSFTHNLGPRGASAKRSGVLEGWKTSLLESACPPFETRSLRALLRVKGYAAQVRAEGHRFLQNIVTAKTRNSSGLVHSWHGHLRLLLLLTGYFYLIAANNSSDAGHNQDKKIRGPNGAKRIETEFVAAQAEALPDPLDQGLGRQRQVGSLEIGGISRSPEAIHGTASKLERKAQGSARPANMAQLNARSGARSPRIARDDCGQVA